MPEDFELICVQCEGSMRAQVAWAGDAVMCPHCSKALRVPKGVDPHTEALRAEHAGYSTRSVFNFPCPRCEGLLQAHSGMIKQRGTCPTCTARFVIPELRRGGKPRKAELLEDESAEMTAPLHAYAGSGETAPQIITTSSGETVIACPKCSKHNPIDAEFCESCETPFTLESSPSTAVSRAGRRATLALILGGVGLLAFPTFLPGLAAIWFGTRAAFDPTGVASRGPAIAGIVMGALAETAGGLWLYWMLR